MSSSKQEIQGEAAIRRALIAGRDLLDELAKIPANAGSVVTTREDGHYQTTSFRSESEAIEFAKANSERDAQFWPETQGRILAI